MPALTMELRRRRLQQVSEAADWPGSIEKRLILATGSPVARLPVRDPQQLHRPLAETLGAQFESSHHAVDEACQATVDGASLGCVEKWAVRRWEAVPFGRPCG